MTKPKCWPMIFIVLMSLILMIRDGRAEIDIVNCSSNISCSVKTYRAEYPIAMEGRSLAASSAAPVPSDNTVTTILDGIGTGAVCNKTWQNLSSSSGQLDLQNTISCRGSGDRQTIEMDMELYNQATLDIPHEAAPSESGYAEPASTSESTSYCQKETFEFGECISTPQGRLCSVDMAQCEPTYASPECADGGFFNPQIDNCEYPVESPGGAYFPHLQKCVAGRIQACEGRECEPVCPAGYSELGGLCVQAPCEVFAREYVFFRPKTCVSRNQHAQMASTIIRPISVTRDIQPAPGAMSTLVWNACWRCGAAAPMFALMRGHLNPARKPEKKRATVIFPTVGRSILLQANAWDRYISSMERTDGGEATG